MEDKTFDLLTQMDSDFTTKMKQVEGKLDQIEAKLDQKADKSDIIRLEVEHGKKLEALFNGYKQMSEELNDIKNIVSDISTKVDQHEIRIQAIEGWRT